MTESPIPDNKIEHNSSIFNAPPTSARITPSSPSPVVPSPSSPSARPDSFSGSSLPSTSSAPALLTDSLPLSSSPSLAPATQQTASQLNPHASPFAPSTNSYSTVMECGSIVEGGLGPFQHPIRPLMELRQGNIKVPRPSVVPLPLGLPFLLP